MVELINLLFKGVEKTHSLSLSQTIDIKLIQKKTKIKRLKYSISNLNFSCTNCGKFCPTFYLKHKKEVFFLKLCCNCHTLDLLLLFEYVPHYSSYFVLLSPYFILGNYCILSHIAYLNFFIHSFNKLRGGLGVA